MLMTGPPPVVITGGSRGLGRALATGFLQRGHPVVISGRDEKALAAAGETLGPLGEVEPFACDVSDAGAVQRLAGHAVERFGPPGIWINNAGYATGGRNLAGTDPATLQAMVDTNLRGTMHGCRAALPLLESSAGILVNLYGAGADGRHVPNMLGYATTKAAVRMLTSGLVRETAGGAVRVYGLNPGLVLTEGLEREMAVWPQEVIAARLPRLNLLADRPEDIAAWVVPRILARPRSGTEFIRLTRVRILGRKLVQPFRPRVMLRSDGSRAA